MELFVAGFEAILIFHVLYNAAILEKPNGIDMLLWVLGACVLH